jgi:hypothetical protein
MTTHEMRPEMDSTAAGQQRPQPVQMQEQTFDEATERPVEPVTAENATATGTPNEASPETVSREAPESRPAAESSDQTLFADRELSDFHSRWTEVQAGFVDDPRDCVQKADGLVADVVDKLTAGFAQARSGLEEQWSRGEEVSTEDLRIALQRYRDFFERLLAV